MDGRCQERSGLRARHTGTTSKEFLMNLLLRCLSSFASAAIMACASAHLAAVRNQTQLTTAGFDAKIGCYGKAGRNCRGVRGAAATEKRGGGIRARVTVVWRRVGIAGAAGSEP
ncbi:hypothetical protein U9M48_009320 [Paspalum notatum var. saurae]|uniref:Uncharacterized protein n=1 Tax=Paspalum notatum var. saurae TaxID=547442 RepID=A0AAQ3WEU0_PASNO